MIIRKTVDISLNTNSVVQHPSLIAFSTSFPIVFFTVVDKALLVLLVIAERSKAI